MNDYVVQNEVNTRTLRSHGKNSEQMQILRGALKTVVERVPR